jgi:hypothetical protein
MTREEIRAHVVTAISEHGCQLALNEITDDTAMAQDAIIDGIDVHDFGWALKEQLGDVVDTIPWERFSDQRSSFYGCGVLLFPFWLIARVLMWPINREILRRRDNQSQRLTVRHLTDVFERGAWFEPTA